MPFTVENGELGDSLDYSFYKSSFSHRNEKAEPGYYRVVLDRNRVMAEMTVNNRNAIHKYTFPSIGKKGLVIDLKHRDVVINSAIHISKDSGDILITGYRTSSAWNPEQHFYFAMKVDCDIDNLVLYKQSAKEASIKGNAIEEKTGIEGDDCKAIINLPDNVKEVSVSVGISSVDEAGAINNLRQSNGITFQQAKKEAHITWEKALAQFEVEGGRREDRSNFYTALYHCMTSPYLYSDADGRYRAMKDSSGNYSIQQTNEGRNQYTVFSLWDTYRALHPLLNITDPERSRDFVLTMLDQYRHGGEQQTADIGTQRICTRQLS